jgi:hypothetical protein
MDSQDIKYVVNSIISAIDLSKLDEDDKEDILDKFESFDDYGMGEEGDLDITGEDDFGMGDEGMPPMGDEGMPPMSPGEDEGMPPPTGEDEGMPPMGDEEENIDVDVDVEPKEKKVSDLKRIQILVGKLSQKIRSYEESKELSAKDVKYIINSILSAIDGLQPKIELYEAFKSFNDKWIAGSEFKDRTLYQDVMFLDRANRDIGDKVLIDVYKLKDFFSGTTSLDTRIIDFVSRIIADNQFQMMPLPAYMNFWGVGEVTQGAPPRTETSNNLAKLLRSKS